MKRTFVVLVVILVLALSVPSALAQGPSFPPGGVSGVQVVNVGTGTATVGAVYYAEDGTKYTLPNQTLDNPGDSFTYFKQPADVDSFSGAAILSSDQEIVAIANTAFGSRGTAAYGSASQGATSVLLPLALNNFFGQSTTIGVQNTDTQNSINVDVTYTPQGGSPTTQSHSIQPGASRIIHLANEGLADGFIGSATIAPQDGTTPIVASAMIYTQNYVYAYSGFTQTGTEYFLPLVRSAFAGTTTGIQVVDASNSNTQIQIAYTGFIDANSNFTQDSGEAYTCEVQATIAAGSSVTAFNGQNSAFTNVLGAVSGSTSVIGGTCQSQGHANFAAAGGPFLGAAKVTGDSAIAVVVNDAAGSTSSGAYNGYLASEASNSVVSPLARSGFAGLTTGTQVQNIS